MAACSLGQATLAICVVAAGTENAGCCTAGTRRIFSVPDSDVLEPCVSLFLRFARKGSRLVLPPRFFFLCFRRNVYRSCVMPRTSVRLRDETRSEGKDDLGPAIAGTNPLLALEHFSRHVRPHIVF